MVTVGCAAILEAVAVQSWVVLALCLLSVLLSAKDVQLAWHRSAFEPDISRVCQIQPKPASRLTAFDCAIS